MTNRQEHGMTLVELLVAATLGLIVLAAILQAMVLHNQGFRRSETLALLQEQAATAMRLIRNDVMMAGHWGLAGSAHAILGHATPIAPNPRSLRVPTRCPAEITLAITTAIDTRNPASWRCDITPVNDSDGMLLRFADATTGSPAANRLQLASSGIQHHLISNGRTSTDGPMQTEVRDLHVRGFYIAASSSLFPGQPVLRRLTLNALSRRPIYIDEEIAAGVERLKLRVAVDSDADGYADLWIPAGASALSSMRDRDDTLSIKAVEVSLVMRSAEAVFPHEATKPLVLGEERWIPPADGHLRFASRMTIPVLNRGAAP